MKIKNEQEVIELLREDVENTDKKVTVIQSGHFPLRVNARTKKLEEDILTWGDFSLYTLELGCRVGEYGKIIGKDVRLILLCDDHSYKELDKRYLVDGKNLTSAQLDNRWRAQRDEIYKRISGEHAKVIESYSRILQAHGFDERDILRHDHGKEGRTNCLYFSENVLRTSQKSIEDICSREYVELLESEQLKILNPYFISFIPQRCFDSICSAVDFEIEDFNGSHIFMETGQEITKDNIYSQGIGSIYKKNN